MIPALLLALSMVVGVTIGWAARRVWPALMARLALSSEQGRRPFPVCNDCLREADQRHPLGWVLVVPIATDETAFHRCDVCDARGAL